MNWRDKLPEARMKRAREDADAWRERWGESFRVSSGRRMCSPMIEMPDGSQVHRSHLLYMRQHGLVSFEMLARDSLVRLV